MAQRDVLIGYLHPSTVDSAFHDSLVRLLMKDRGRRILDVAAAESGPYITDGRNALAEIFLASRASWYLQVDCDMELPEGLIERLLRHATPNRVVGGLAFAYNGRTRHAIPVMFDEAGERITAWEPGALVPVGFTGGACLMIHRRIFEQTPRPWFQNAPGANMDQDQMLCLGIRQAGGSIAVDTSTVIGHAKRILVDARDYVMPRAVRLDGPDRILETS